LNEICSFGEACSKKALCRRLHPGEEWSEELCIRRV
jgi:hypothetical protein